MAIWHKGKKQKKESVEKRRQSLIDYYSKNPHPMAGKHLGYKRKSLDDSVKKEIGDRKRGTHHSDFTRLMMSRARKGVIHSGSFKKGMTSWCKGKKFSPEHILKLKIKRQGRVIQNHDTLPEKIMQIALSLNKIKFEKQKKLEGTPDLFVEPDICIFVDGDYIHGDPRKYGLESLVMGGKTAREKWNHDAKINQILIKNGYRIIRFWDSDIKKDAQICVERLKNLINSRRLKRDHIR